MFIACFKLNSTITKTLFTSLISSCLWISFTNIAQAINMGFQTELKITNNESANDRLDIFNTSDSGLSITGVVLTLGTNAELDTGVAFPSVNSSAVRNTHWGSPLITVGSNGQGLTTNLNSFSDGATQLTFDFTQGQFNPGEGVSFLIDFDQKGTNNSSTDPSGSDLHNSIVGVTFSNGSVTNTLSYKYTSGGGKSFPTDFGNGNTTPTTGLQCTVSSTCNSSYTTSNNGTTYPYAYAEFAVPFEFSPSLGLLISLGMFGGHHTLKKYQKLNIKKQQKLSTDL
jgi:hypothetical protein